MKKLLLIPVMMCLVFIFGCRNTEPYYSKGEKCETKAECNECKRVSLRDRVGSTHVVGRYHLTDKDFLNEGADQILEMGSRVIKVWFYDKRYEHPEVMYSYNSDWPQVETLLEGAQLPYYRDLFNKPFTTYMLATTNLARPSDYWREGITEEQKQDEQKAFYDLTKYLLETYRNTGKTFIFQHWEGDWMIRDGIKPGWDPPQVSIDGMIGWLNARQAGVNQARKEVGQNGVWVYHATEINRVVDSMQEGKINMVNAVLPHVNVDLISYSAWDSTVDYPDQPELFRQALDYIAAHAQPSEAFGNKNVYLGEFGLPENEFPSERIQALVINATETALDWGCPYVVYWQLYCNELSDSSLTQPVKNNENVRGFWLVRPDGSQAWPYHYFAELLKNEP